MKFTMVTPCADCPFRKGTAMGLRAGFIRELHQLMLSPGGGTFSCHETVEAGCDPDDEVDDEDAIHCAGALAYALKHDTLPQLARICEGFGEFDGDEILARSGDLVWDDLRQWLKANSALSAAKAARNVAKPERKGKS